MRRSVPPWIAASTRSGAVVRRASDRSVVDIDGSAAARGRGPASSGAAGANLPAVTCSARLASYLYGRERPRLRRQPTIRFRRRQSQLEGAL
ncbi:MAG: hypothetical protein V7637_3157 [Mycobacteriales bacterium]